MQLIAEVKRASPSAGLIRQMTLIPSRSPSAMREAGAACISVLTDEPFFQGSLDSPRAVRHAVDLPLLRKDFIVDRYQLLQAREAGADCVLLIAECLSPDELRALHDQAVELGLQTLIELYEPENLDAVLATGTASGRSQQSQPTHFRNVPSSSTRWISVPRFPAIAWWSAKAAFASTTIWCVWPVAA